MAKNIKANLAFGQKCTFRKHKPHVHGFYGSSKRAVYKKIKEEYNKVRNAERITHGEGGKTPKWVPILIALGLLTAAGAAYVMHVRSEEEKEYKNRTGSLRKNGFLEPQIRSFEDEWKSTLKPTGNGIPYTQDEVKLAEMDRENRDMTKHLFEIENHSVSRAVHGDSDNDRIINQTEIFGPYAPILNPLIPNPDEKLFLEYLSSLDENNRKIFSDFVLSDKCFSQEEKEQVEFLSSLENSTHEGILREGLICNFDVDNDKMNNRFEQIFLDNGLYDPFVKNDRYVLIFEGTGSQSYADDQVNACLRQKIPPQNIFKLVENQPETWGDLVNLESKIDNLINEIANRSDNNDFVFITNSSHSGNFYGPKGPIAFNNLLNTIDTKALVYVTGECTSNEIIPYFAEGSCPRVVIGESDNYSGGELPRSLILKLGEMSKCEDLDGDGYISFLESFESCKAEIMEGNPHYIPSLDLTYDEIPKIIDLDNLANKIYL